MGRLLALLSLVLLVPVAAADPLADRSIRSTPAAPVYGPALSDVPTVTNFAPLTGSLAVDKGNAASTLTVAPLLFAPGDYVPGLSELRVVTQVSTNGEASLGGAWGLHGPRIRTKTAMSSFSPQLWGNQKGLGDQWSMVGTGQVKDAVSGFNDSSPALEKLQAERAALVGRIGKMLDALCAQGDSTVCGIANDPARKSKYEEDWDGWAGRLRTLAQSSTGPLGGLIFLLIDYEDLKQRAADLRNAAVTASSKTLVKDLLALRNRLSYRLNGAFFVQGNIGLFPLVDAPAVVPKDSADGVARDGFHHLVKSWNVTGLGQFWFSQYATMLVRGGFLRTRADSVVGSTMGSAVTWGADFGSLIRIGEPTMDGFQPGVGLGLSYTGRQCLATDGCKTKLGTASDPQFPTPLPLRSSHLVAGFVEGRIRKELQVRLGIEVAAHEALEVERAQPAQDRYGIVTVTPTLKLNSSFWGL